MVSIPIAVAFIPPLGAVVSPIVGVLVNPDPSFKRDIPVSYTHLTLPTKRIV